MRPRGDILDKCLAKTRPGPSGLMPGRNVEEHCRIAGAVCQELLLRLLSFLTAGREHIPENTDLAVGVDPPRSRGGVSRCHSRRR